MIIFHTYMEEGWDERSLLLTAIESDAIDMNEMEELENAIREDEAFDKLEVNCVYKLIVGRAYIDAGLRAHNDPGTQYWHIKFVDRLVFHPHEGFWKEDMPSF